VWHIRGFLSHRQRIDSFWHATSPHQTVARGLYPFSQPLVQQRRLGDGAVVETVEELFGAAEAGRNELREVLGGVVAACAGCELKMAPLKQRARALEKARGAGDGVE
jgi:hypothetical protein